MRIALLTIAAALTLYQSPAEARILGLGGAAKATPVASPQLVENIQQALDEQRFVDAARMLDQALLAGIKDRRLIVLSGDLNLERGQYDAALAAYRAGENDPASRSRALQGQGIVLAVMGRSADALPALQKAVENDPQAWRAWNALAAEYDKRGKWSDAEAAYEKALAASGADPIVLNNRGYSRLLQRRRDEAVSDLVAALQKRPAFEEARTNLRLALAFGGEYERSIAGGAPEDQAALLNNAGFAAGLRGDYVKAEDLLDRAKAAKGEYYARASENLKIVKALGAHADGTNDVP